MMTSIIFAIALSSLLSIYNVEATSRNLSGQVVPALEEICSKTEFSKECSSSLVQFIDPSNVDANASLIAGLKSLEALTTKAITEAENLSNQNLSRAVAEELLIGMAVCFVVSNTTKNAQEAIHAQKITELIREIKLASDVSGELVDTFKHGIDGKNDILKDINVNVHNLAQNNFAILGMVMKAQNNNDQDINNNVEEKEDAALAPALGPVSAPAPAPASSSPTPVLAPVSATAPVSSPMAEPPN